MAANPTDGVPYEQLDEVVNALNRESMTWRRMPESPLASLVTLLRHGTIGNKGYRILFQMFESNQNFMATPSRELDTFKSLQKSFPWMRKAARIAYANVVRSFKTSPRDHWIISEVFHFLYDLPKEFIYSEIVKHWTSAFSVTKEKSGLWTEVDMQDLISFMMWTVTKEVAKVFADPYNHHTRLVLDRWSRESLNSEISGSLTFGTTMRLMPFNMKAANPDGTFLSLQDILAGGPVWDYIAAHVLYPNVFTVAPEPDTIKDITYAIRTALSGGASLQQVQQIYPYTDNPSRAALMADIARSALAASKLDVAVAYGFGPSFLAYIDTTPSYTRHKLLGSSYSGWHIYDVLDEVPVKDQLRFLRSLGFDSQYANELIDRHANYLGQ